LDRSADTAQAGILAVKNCASRKLRFVPLRSTDGFARGTASAALLLKEQRVLQLSDRLR
jgi:hypothetical protein